MDAKLRYLTHTITYEEKGRIVKDILHHSLGFTVAKVRSVKFDSRGILLDGQRVSVAEIVQEGQILSVLLTDSENRKERILPMELPLDILYEDEDLLAVYKPAGMVCHPSKGHMTDSLANGVKGYFERKKENSGIHLIGRLDKDTSGVVLIAKHGAAAERMGQQREAGTLRKTYWALALGQFETKQGCIDIPMAEERGEHGLLYMKEGHKEAHTEYEVLWQGEEFALCRVNIGTGRTHQIRFHMAQMGHPLLGDPIYGRDDQKEAFDITRTALHAGELIFRQPYSGEEIMLRTELPQDMGKIMLPERVPAIKLNRN